MLRAVGRVEQCLSTRADSTDVVTTVQQQAPNLFPERRSAGFTCADHLCTARCKPITEQLSLGGLPDPVAALQRDK